MTFPYGYVMQTEGVDGEGVDCFLGDNPYARNAYVIHALAAPHFVDYDEDKAMLGFDSAEHAMMAFLENYSDTRFYGGMHPMPMEEFTEKVLASAGEIIKSRVRQHQRATLTGKVANVHEYDRTTKPAHTLVYPHDPDAWIGIDFDGTLSQDIGEYDAHGFAKPGPPVPLMLERVKRWIAEKRNVKLLSARAADAANVQIVQDWLHEHGLPSLPVTRVKDSKMIALYDDRAITVERNTGRLFHEVNEDYNGRIGRHRPVDKEEGTS